jgi:hypothetical protein
MWTTRFDLVAFICVAAASQLTIATSCSAQVQCSNVSGGTSYKVLIDEVQYSPPSGAQQSLSLELVQHSIAGSLEVLRQAGNLPEGSILYLECKGRHPQEADFKESVIRDMAANHAILEFWGTVFPGGRSQRKLDIRYVMFPVASFSAPAPSGFASTEKPIMGAKPTLDEVTRFVSATRDDMSAYFTAATGVQAYADRNWERAERFLCQARTRLKGNPAQHELMDFVDQLASKAAAELRKNRNTVASLLTDAQAKDYCSFATTR